MKEVVRAAGPLYAGTRGRQGRQALGRPWAGQLSTITCQAKEASRGEKSGPDLVSPRWRQAEAGLNGVGRSSWLVVYAAHMMVKPFALALSLGMEITGLFDLVDKNPARKRPDSCVRCGAERVVSILDRYLSRTFEVAGEGWGSFQEGKREKVNITWM